MNIKSLLLGSAAALVAVSGARAADAVVIAEPEPMEYVRVCDVYGAGFYYIPGTETCLKIGGMVRYEIGADEFGNDEGWNKDVLARLRLDARSETEYGTFRRFIEIEHSIEGGGWDADRTAFDMKGEGGTKLRHAYFELGGLLVGHTDSLFDGELSGEFDVSGGERVNQIRYTFDAGNGIAVSLGLEEESDDFDYVPLVTGKVGITQGWGSLDLYAGYDDAYEEFALKAIATIKATDALTVELLAGYESGPTFFSINPDINGISGPYIGYAWTAGGYLKYQFNEKLAAGFGGQYYGDAHANNLASRAVDGNNDWVVGGVVDYNIVENLAAKLAVNYYDGDSFVDGGFAGFLRLEAAF